MERHSEFAEKSTHITEHLSNERTYLAWLRTSFSLLTLGFATNKFGKFLDELHARPEHQLRQNVFVDSRHFGVGMVILGTILILIACWQYQRNRRAIDQQVFRPSSNLIWIVTALAFVFALSAAFLVLHS